MKLSLIVPCYNEAENVAAFQDAVITAFEGCGYDYEIIFEDDGSKDATLHNLKKLHGAQRCPVTVVSFSRNFGKEAGLYAGLKAAKGDYVAVMDVDLQDPPELLDQMFSLLKSEDYDCVATRRSTRKGEPPIRSAFAKLFYNMINKISDTEIVDGARDYRLMKRKMVDAILSLGEYNRFSKGLFSWVGFKTKWIEYENIERSAGTTKWSFWKLFKYSLDGIMAFSVTPLAIASVIGILLCALAIFMIFVIVAKTLIWGDPVAGYPSLICVILLMSGKQLFCTGIVGQYVAKMYLETKQRPIYIIREDNL